jgi:hypothetical protein
MRRPTASSRERYRLAGLLVLLISRKDRLPDSDTAGARKSARGHAVPFPRSKLRTTAPRRCGSTRRRSFTGSSSDTRDQRSGRARRDSARRTVDLRRAVRRRTKISCSSRAEPSIVCVRRRGADTGWFDRIGFSEADQERRHTHTIACTVDGVMRLSDRLDVAGVPNHRCRPDTKYAMRSPCRRYRASNYGIDGATASRTFHRTRRRVTWFAIAISHVIIVNSATLQSSRNSA